MHEKQWEDLVLSWSRQDQVLIKECETAKGSMVYEEDEFFERKGNWSEKRGDVKKAEK